MPPLEPRDNFCRISVVTFTLWATAAAISIVGLVLPYPQPQPTPPPVSTQTDLISVAIAPAPAPVEPVKMPAPSSGDPSTASATSTPPRMPQLPALAPAPPLTVAAASPTISFAIPTASLITLADATHPTRSLSAGALPRVPITSSSNQPTASQSKNESIATPTLTHLTLGQGEGRQPAPLYPHDAQLAAQEGSVTARFTVDPSGHVTTLTLTAPSRWPALNQAAANAIKNTWRFAPGPPRVFDVTIDFQLSE
jgi:protein TonB